MSFYDLNPRRRGERMARRLERHPDYRVLRRLPLVDEFWCRSMPVPTDTLVIGVLDTETTGLDPTHHKMIELAVARLTIDLNQGDVVDVSAPLSWLEDPGEPLTLEIEALTGLRDADLLGAAFPEAEIRRQLNGIDLLVSHNARFDAGFCRARFPWLAHSWGCSARELDWPAHGMVGGRSMGALLTAAGFFLPDAHRAGPDTWALTCLLAMPAGDGRAIAAHLVDAAKRTSTRLYAERAPFAVKNDLKAAGYRWSPECRAWWIEGDDERIGNEAVWLRGLSPAIAPRLAQMNCHNRYVD